MSVLGPEDRDPPSDREDALHDPVDEASRGHDGDRALTETIDETWSGEPESPASASQVALHYTIEESWDDPLRDTVEVGPPRGHSEYAEALDPEAATSSRRATPDLESGMAAVLSAAKGSMSSREDQRQADIVRRRLFGANVSTPRVGRYALLGRLGEGAMGVVYSAYDDKLDRKLAVKVIRGTGDPDGPEAGRLYAEAQAMAKVSHPNVVQIYEVGTFEGDMYIAMEFVRGETLSDWWVDTPRVWSEIVAMFVQAGRGLAAAHEAGLVHRDFKTDNVLVGEDGRARVTDFGLARRVDVDRPTAADSSLIMAAALSGKACASANPRLTSTGAVLGTPAYMSPEQHRGEPADARSDQYAFCLALYEALYGERPFAGTSRFELAEATAAGHVRPAPGGTTVPTRLRRLVVRGLAPKPEDRHPSMAALLDALEQTTRRSYLAWGIGAAVAAAALVVAFARGGGDPEPPCLHADRGFDATWNDMVRADLSSSLSAAGSSTARDTATRVTELLDGYAQAWRDSARRACEATHVQLTQSTNLLDLRVACLERRRQRFAAAVDVLGQGGPEVVRRAVGSVESLPQLDPCNDAVRLRDWPDSGRDVDADVLAAVRGDVSRALQLQVIADYTNARPLAEAALTGARELGDAPLIAEALHAVGKVVAWSDDQQRGVDMMLEAADLAEGSRHDELLADVWIDLTKIAAGPLADAARGQQWLRRARASARRLGSPVVRDLALRTEEGSLLLLAGEPARARDVLAALLPELEREPSAALLLGDAYAFLANAQRSLGEHDAALANYGYARSHFAGRLGPTHPRVADNLQNEAVLLTELGRFDEAMARFDEAETIFDAAFGQDSYDHGYLIFARAATRHAAGDLEAGYADAVKADAIFRDKLGPHHVQVADTAHLMGMFAIARGDHHAALASFERALAIAERHPQAMRGFQASFRSGVGESWLGLGDPAKALEHFDAAIAELAEAPEFPPAFGLWAHRGRGVALLELGRLTDAITELEAAMATGEKVPGMPFELAETRWGLARALVAARSDRERAIELAREARDGFAELHAAGVARVEAIDRWLAEHRAIATAPSIP